MKPLKCVAIDDEPLALKLLSKYAEQFSDLDMLHVFEDAISGAKYLAENEIDLLFIDVNMPDLNGVDLVKALENKPLIIFTTAYKNYAYESFELEAIAYLLKPISFKRFAEAVERTIAYFNYKNNQQNDATLGDIYVYFEYKMLKIPLKNVRYIESLSDYVKIHFIDGSTPILTLTTLKKILEKLPQAYFLRVHRSYIVAKTQIQSFHNRKIELGTITLPIGDSYYDQVQLILKKRAKMKLRTNIATSENGFIFNPVTGDSYMGNQMATEIIGLLKQENSLTEIKQMILSKYEVESQQFDRDLEDLVHQLKEANLLD